MPERRNRITEEQHMSIEKFKLAVLGLDEFSDLEIEKLFLNLEISSEEDIHEAVGILKVHRPQVIEDLTFKYCHPNAIQ